MSRVRSGWGPEHRGQEGGFVLADRHEIVAPTKTVSLAGEDVQGDLRAPRPQSSYEGLGRLWGNNRIAVALEDEKGGAEKTAPRAGAPLCREAVAARRVAVEEMRSVGLLETYALILKREEVAHRIKQDGARSGGAFKSPQDRVASRTRARQDDTCRIDPPLADEIESGAQHIERIGATPRAGESEANTASESAAAPIIEVENGGPEASPEEEAWVEDGRCGRGRSAVATEDEGGRRATPGGGRIEPSLKSQSPPFGKLPILGFGKRRLRGEAVREGRGQDERRRTFRIDACHARRSGECAREDERGPSSDREIAHFRKRERQGTDRPVVPAAEKPRRPRPDLDEHQGALFGESVMTNGGVPGGSPDLSGGFHKGHRPSRLHAFDPPPSSSVGEDEELATGSEAGLEKSGVSAERQDLPFVRVPVGIKPGDDETRAFPGHRPRVPGDPRQAFPWGVEDRLHEESGLFVEWLPTPVPGVEGKKPVAVHGLVDEEETTAAAVPDESAERPLPGGAVDAETAFGREMEDRLILFLDDEKPSLTVGAVRSATVGVKTAPHAHTGGTQDADPGRRDMLDENIPAAVLGTTLEPAGGAPL